MSKTDPYAEHVARMLAFQRAAEDNPSRQVLRRRARKAAKAQAASDRRDAIWSREKPTAVARALTPSPGMVVVNRRSLGLPPKLKRAPAKPLPDGRHAWQRKEAAAEALRKALEQSPPSKVARRAAKHEAAE